MLSTSPEIQDIAAALAGAQLTMDNAIKETVNPAFRTKYADLAAVRAAVNLPLSQAGIACVQAPAVDLDRGMVSVETRLIHKGGQWLACTLSASPKDKSPQAVGSTITYLRRYGLLAITGIAPDDDDGNAGNGREYQAPRQEYREPQRAEHRPEPAREEPPARRWSDKERAGFCADLGKMGLGYDNVAAWCESMGRPRPSGMEPTQRSALLSALMTPAMRSKFDAFAKPPESK